MVMAGAALAIAAAAVALASCGSSSSSGGGSPTPSSTIPSFNAVPMASGTIVGAGASFPAPIYTKWGTDYASVNGIKLNYQSIGSGGGISAIESKVVDFGASDAPLQEADLQSNGLVQFPGIIGGDVMVVNLSGITSGQLKLTADLIAGMYAGKITMWNDPAITKVNPGLKLPATKVNIVHRSDGSGTTWIFTHYLTAAAPSVWTYGADKEVPWPLGVGGKGNAGVATAVQQIPGSIGYVEYAYAKQANMTTTQLQNKDGNWLQPSLQTFQAAAAKADWKGSLPSMYVLLVNEPGAQSWPITGASFILVQKDQTDAARAKQTLSFFDWAYKSGGASAQSLDYVPIPASAVNLITTQVWPTVTVSGTPVWP